MMCLHTVEVREKTVAGGAVPIVLVALLLGGCATSHIGSEWPCPASLGTPCTSVAGADPARGVEAGVQDAQRPLHRTDGNEGIVRASDSENGSKPATNRCSRGCRPFAWLRRLGSKPAGVSMEEEPDRTAIGAQPGTGDEPVDTAVTPMDSGGAAAAQPPRTEEVVGRIWIAPYVDANGVYHEASWVQTVLEPAGWWLP